jgi:arsenite-transporting ATPase
MLQLPSAWSTFISENTHGASCLGQLSGLEQRKEIYKQAVKTLADSNETIMILVSRPEISPLMALGISNQILVINAILNSMDESDAVSKQIYDKQQEALQRIPESLKKYTLYTVPMRSYNLSNIVNIRRMLYEDVLTDRNLYFKPLTKGFTAEDLIDDLYQSGKRVVFVMGKGGVGKTTLAKIAMGLAKRGSKVHLTTTDPADHLNYIEAFGAGISVSKIDEAEVLEVYKNEVRAKVAGTISTSDMEYIEEDLRSPCTQEIAVFKAFAQIVEKADREIVVIDTAPTGHTLLLLDATESYHREVQRTQGDSSEAVRNLLPRLRNPQETEVVIVTLPEATPVFEAERLQKDLQRAGIHNKWWIVNSCFSLIETRNPFLKEKAIHELKWIEMVKELSDNHAALVKWDKSN